MTLKEKILFFLEERGIKKNDFYRDTGIAASNFKGNGLQSELGGDKIVKILTLYPELSSDWLLTDKGSMLRSDSPVSTPTSSSDDSIIYKMYQEKDAEVGRLREEIGALKNEIRRYKEENEVREKFVSDVSSESESTKGSGVKPPKVARSGNLGGKNKVVI